MQGDTVIEGTHTFTTGSGAVQLQGNTLVTGTKTLTVGAAGASGGNTQLYGNLIVSESGVLKTVTNHGHYQQSGSAGTFSTGTGAVGLNGDTTIASGKYFHMSGAGTFTTSTGTNTLGGNVVVDGTKSFTSGSGAVSLLGSTTIADDKDFTVGASGSTGATVIYTPVTIGHASNLATLTLKGNFAQSGSVTFVTGTGQHTLNGDVLVDGNNYLKMSSTSTGAFETGVGTVVIRGDITQDGAKTFTTGTGAVTLRGSTSLPDNVPFTVGVTGGTGSDAQFFGNTYIGGNTNAGDQRSLTVRGDVTFSDVSSHASTFATATGQVTLNGDVLVAKDKDLAMDTSGNGAGTFSTGTGAVALNGDVTVAASEKLMITDQNSGAHVQCTTESAHDNAKSYCFAR